MTTALARGFASRLDRGLGAATRSADSWRDRLAPGSWWRRLAGAAAFVVRGCWHVWRNRRYLTAAKLANMALINLEFAAKRERVWGRPYRLKIESTNVCNTRCQLCPTGIGLRGRPRGHLSLEDFQSLVDRLRRFLYVLDLSMWGDPLLTPHIWDMVGYAHDRRIWTYLSTNLHAFDVERGDVEALFRSGLDMMTVSLHGASQETFAAYQPGMDFERTLKKLRSIVDAKRERGLAKPVIQLNFVVTRKNQHERESFRRLAAALDCQPLFSAPSLNVRFLDRDRSLEPLGLDAAEIARRTAAKLREWLPDDEAMVVEPYRRMRDGDLDPASWNGTKPMRCDWPWRSGVINWDGSVVTCCGVFEQSDDMGNVFTQPFGEIWNGLGYRMARRSFRRSAPQPAGYANPCRECPGFLP
jgi:MoaA/NifB/PqqE/SkfB family radical SAM enzyme